MPHRELDSVVDELYSAPREDFIALRKERAKAARADGDADLAKEIDKLTKPTSAAWLANQLARSDSAEVRELASLGEALREAHEQLDGAEIKSLSHKRTELIRGLVERADALSDGTMSESVTRELEEILTRSVAESEVGQALVSGRMTSAKGFAPGSGWPSLPAGPAPAKPAKPKAKAKSASDLEQAKAALKDARAAVKEAEAARAEDERALADAEAAVDEAAAEVKRLGEELDAAEAREKRARGMVGLARRAVKESERLAAAAWKQVQQAEQRLADLDEQ